eukprot:SAG11_NODE_13521_length_651_cov_1.125000_1_plen_52_part_01
MHVSQDIRNTLKPGPSAFFGTAAPPLDDAPRPEPSAKPHLSLEKHRTGCRGG